MTNSYEFRPVYSFGPVLGGGTPKANETNWNGSIPFVTPTELSGLNGKQVGEAVRSVTETGALQTTTIESGVLVSCRAPIGSIGTTSSRMSFNQGCKGIPVSDERQARYLAYALVSARETLEARGNGTTFSEISSAALGQIRIPAPPLQIQIAIADYLDRETAEIEAMMADLEKMETLLTERRGSIVRTHLLPEGKEYTRVKLKAAVSLGKTVQSKQKNAEEVQRNYVRAAHIQPHGRLALDEQPMWFTTSELEQLSLRANDVLVVEGGAGYGRSVVLKEDLPEWGFQNHVIRVRPNPGVVGEFIHYTFLAHYNAGLIDLLADGATIPALSSDKARELPILSVDEHCQRKIVDIVERETAEIDAMLADITELRDLLAERRAAVIAAAVTGQIDIPTAEETTHA